MSTLDKNRSPLEILPAGATTRLDVEIEFTAANQAFGTPVNGTKKLEIIFLIRFSDFSYFGPIIVFQAIEIGTSATKNIRVPAKNIEETFVFWKESVGTVMANRATTVSINDKTMSTRPININVGWGLTVLHGVAYERAEASMYS